jgi:hypothetical protein
MLGGKHGELIMTPRGLYRYRYPLEPQESGAEYACVLYGTVHDEGVSRPYYEQSGYEPPFDKLPTKEEYEANGGKS